MQHWDAATLRHACMDPLSRAEQKDARKKDAATLRHACMDPIRRAEQRDVKQKDAATLRHACMDPLRRATVQKDVKQKACHSGFPPSEGACTLIKGRTHASWKEQAATCPHLSGYLLVL
eukprot:239951-Pelagomonas_calceolata.AAC.2